MRRSWIVGAVLFCGCFVGPVGVVSPPRAVPRAPMRSRPDGARPEGPRTVLVERGGPVPAIAPAPVPTDGLEAKPGWRAADLAQWKDANPSQAGYVDHAETGKLLLVRWKGEGKDKAAVGRAADLKLPAAGRIRFRTYSYADREVKLALGFFTGDERAYYETPTVKVPPKAWADHAIELGMSYFKCAASKWRHAAPLAKPGEVKELVVLVYDAGSGSLYVDALVVPGQ